MVDLFSHQHFQQDEHAAKEADAAMRKFLMQRFLQAAADVATEHKNSLPTFKKKIVSTSPSPISSPRLSRRMPTITCCIKSRALQAHSLTQYNSAQQTDPMPHSMSSFSCLGLDSLLFCAHRRVRSAPRSIDHIVKGSLVPNPPYRTRVASERNSEIEGPVNAGYHPPSSQPPADSPYAHYGWPKNFAAMALPAQPVETVEKEMNPRKQAEPLTNSKDDASAYEWKLGRLLQRTRSFSRLRQGFLDSIDDLHTSKTAENVPTSPAKCRIDMLNASGWPFGMLKDHYKQRGKSNPEKLVVGGKGICPPVPATPTESWLAHAIRKNASSTSLLATPQQNEKAE